MLERSFTMYGSPPFATSDSWSDVGEGKDPSDNGANVGEGQDRGAVHRKVRVSSLTAMHTVRVPCSDPAMAV